MKQFPYLIVAPDYRHNSGGIRVLHKLAHLLNQAGQSAFVFCHKTNPEWNSHSISMANGVALAGQGAIVVYPEIVPGNPLAAATVVRYILNNPGLCGGEKSYHPSEIVFCFAKQLLLPGLGQDRVLAIPTVNTSVFFNDDTKRDIDYLVYFGKHPQVKTYPDHKIIYENRPKRQSELGRLLRRCQKLISYDPFTALIFEATLCGCPVVIVPDNFRRKEDIENSEFGFNGMTWQDTPDGLLRARATLPKAPQVLAGLEEQARHELKTFIAITQQAAQSAVRPAVAPKVNYFTNFFRLKKLYREAR